MGRRRIGAARLLYGVCAASLMACAAIVGINDRIPLEAQGEDATVDVPEIDSGECPPSSTCAKVPAGWKLVSVQRDGRDACAEGFGEPRDLDFAETDCTCKCNEVSPARCESEPVSGRNYTNTGCIYPQQTSPSFLSDGGCFAMSLTANTPGSARIVPVPQAAVCDGGTPAPTPLLHGRACAATGPTCADGVCAPEKGGGDRCVVRDGDETCPADFPEKVRGGGGTIDTRGCGSCNCGASVPTNCNEDLLYLYRDKSCTKDRIDVTTACTVFGDGGTYESYRFKPAKVVGCVPTSPSKLLDGGITFTEKLTVCCRRR